MYILLVFVMKKDKNFHRTSNLDSNQALLLRVQIIGGTFTKGSESGSHRGHLYHCLFHRVRFKLGNLDFGRV